MFKGVNSIAEFTYRRLRCVMLIMNGDSEEIENEMTVLPTGMMT
jgi:hypothetical protein